MSKEFRGNKNDAIMAEAHRPSCANCCYNAKRYRQEITDPMVRHHCMIGERRAVFANDADFIPVMSASLRCSMFTVGSMLSLHTFEDDRKQAGINTYAIHLWLLDLKLKGA